MPAFYFDVGGVIIPDRFAPSHALAVFRELAGRYSFSPEAAYATYKRLQPSLDLGAISLGYLCGAIGIEQQAFERDWLAMHPVDVRVASAIEQLLSRGYSVGLATNFCRRLLGLLIGSAACLQQLTVCCSSDIGVVKPSAQFFEHASRLMDSSEIVFVDDRAVNVEAARRFGWTAMQADRGWLPRFESTYLGDSSNG
jgi:putative hydrolase of the HAD superfamily